MAGPTCLKDIAHGLGETGLKTDALLHSERLVFLTAPNCLAELLRPSEPLQRSPLHRHATVMRWVTDWSWAYGNGCDGATIRDYQRRLHEFIRPFNALSMCTVLCEKVQRSPARHARRPPAGSENRRSISTRGGCGTRLARLESASGDVHGANQRAPGGGLFPLALLPIYLSFQGRPEVSRAFR